MKTSLSSIETFDSDGALNAVIETPRGSHNKYDYDDDHGCFKLGGVLPVGASFPFDFGFIPSTLGEDGDPLDVLVLMDEAAFAGCLLTVRVIGVIEADQTERDGDKMRNDRLIAVAAKSRLQRDVHSLEDLNPRLLEEIEHFFRSYNSASGKEFAPLRRSDPQQAKKLIEAGQRRFTVRKS